MKRKDDVSVAWEFLGWVGTALVLGAYALISFGVLVAGDWPYQAMNLFGAIFVGYIAFKGRAYEAVARRGGWGGGGGGGRGDSAGRDAALLTGRERRVQIGDGRPV